MSNMGYQYCEYNLDLMMEFVLGYKIVFIDGNGCIYTW